MNLKKKNTILIGYITLLLVVGYIRESIFLVINSTINNVPFPYNNAYITPPKFLYEIDFGNLILSKWVLTLFFTIGFTALTSALIYKYFKNKSFVILTVIIYSSIFILALLVSSIGFFINKYDELYLLGRLIAGLTQGPLLSLILFVLFYFKNKTGFSNSI
ncbi:MAG: hypothetical protein IT232_10490 [Flavobacteriales bacterium]|nr:hypothetical protein [Flavobacteriales bacterium]